MNNPTSLLLLSQWRHFKRTDVVLSIPIFLKKEVILVDEEKEKEILEKLQNIVEAYKEAIEFIEKKNDLKEKDNGWIL